MRQLILGSRSTWFRQAACQFALAGSVLGACSDDPADSEYDIVIAPSANDHEALQTAFIEAKSGDVIGLEPGTYRLTRELNLTGVADVTLRGMGATRDEVIIDFAGQVEGDDGITVTAPGFTIENLWVKNSPGNGVVAHAEDSTFRNIKVSWDAGSVTENGFYAVYPTDCKRTLIENVEVTGASDAGIYVGSCEYAIVRDNKVYANVAGLEIENTLHADVYDNEVYDNSAGILALLLPNLEIKENRYILFRDNVVRDNNRANFATAGTVVASVPGGVGILVLGGSDIEVRDNTISGNGTSGVLVASYTTLALLTGKPNTDEEMNPYAKRVYIHGNTYTGNGTSPAGIFASLLPSITTFENVLWDGEIDPELESADICLGAEAATFRNLDVPGSFANSTTTTEGHTCTLAALPEMETFPADGQ